MAKLDLTPERAAIIAAARDEWLAAGLSTVPADFDAAEAAISRLYERIGRKRPYFVRLSSPMAAELYINLLVTAWPKMKDQLWDQLRGQLWDQLGDQLRDQLRDQLGDQLRGQLWGQLGGQLWGQLGDQLRDQLRGQLGGQLWDQLRDQLWDQLGGQLRGQLWGQLGGQLRGQLGDQLWGQLRDQVGDQLWGQLRDQLWDQLRGQLRGQKLRFTDTWFRGSWDAYWWGWLDAGRRVGALYAPALNEALDDHCVVTRSCGWVYPFGDFCILTDRPEIISRDDSHRLHSARSAALRYRDGYSLWSWHGLRVSARLIDAPETLTVADIDAEMNAEIRRVMMERYGWARFLKDGGARLIDHDDHWGTLYRREIPGDEPLVMVEVINRSPEPDGSFRHYLLRVSPECRPLLDDGVGEPQALTALNAVASTFGLTGRQYAASLSAES